MEWNMVAELVPRSNSAAAARQERIRELLLEQGSVRSDELAHTLDVSVMTIHRDLDTLARQGWLRKTHGGATVQRSVLFELNVRARMQENGDAKAAIGALATTLVTRGDAVILDDSTSSLAMVDTLRDAGPITLVTNFRKIIDATAGQPDIDLIALGGQYHPSYDSFLGSTTVDALSNMQADIAFVSTSAVTGIQCFHPVPESIAVKKAMLTAARCRVILLDHSKFSKRALHRFVGLDEFDIVVVDDRISADDLRMVRDSAPKVLVTGKQGGKPVVEQA
jgi:DeoR/GlpR family transcriptional regulator of sugar metabolism